MNDFFNEFIEFISPIAFPLLCIFLFPAIFSCIKIVFNCGFSYLDNDSNLSYENELLDYLDNSPVITINNLYSADKDYLVDYYCKHLNDYL